MLDLILKKILDRVLIERPQFGSIYIRFFFHEGRFVKFEFDKSETTVINEEQNNVRKQK